MTKNLGSAAGAAPLVPTAEELLGLVRVEATKFGRCCDLYQDGLGTFADHECQQRTFAMLRSVQQVLGLRKGCGPLSESEKAAALGRARLNNAAPAMLKALERLAACDLNADNCTSLDVATRRIRNIARAAIAKAKGATP